MRIRGGRLPIGRNPAGASDEGTSDEAASGEGTSAEDTSGEDTSGEGGRGDGASGDGQAADGGRGSAGTGTLSSPWPRGAAALLAGALPALAFPAPGLWWFAYVALVPWLLLVRTAHSPRRAALDGWIGGIGFIIAVHHWLVPSLHVFIVLLAALLGLLWAPWGLLVSRLLGGSPSASRAVAAMVVVPSGWLMIELVRSWEGLGGPWGLLGASQWEVAPALRVASVGGVWLVSLLVLAVNTGAALLFADRAARTTAGVLLVVCALSVAAMWAWAPRPTDTGTVRIAVVQPGVVEGPGSVARRFDRGEELTRSLEGRGVDLVVWGESSIGAGAWERPETARRLAELSRRVGADLLVNVDAPQTDGSGRSGIFKSAVLVGPDGPTGDRYDKMRLVPFGEYVPARSLLGWATSVGKAAGEDRLRGDRQVVMTLPDGARGLRIGPLVCFETAFPDMSRRLVRDGAQVIVAQSATSTFQHSWAPAQHASLGALRAAENGRPMVHATLTGISAAYGPRGSGWAARSVRTRARRRCSTCHWRAGARSTAGSATGRCTGRWRRWPRCAPSRGCGRSGGLLQGLPDHPLAQLMGRQGVPGAERLAPAYGVEEGVHTALDTALPGHGDPVAAPPDTGLALVVDDVREVEDLSLGVLAGDFQDLLGRPVQPVHHADRGESVAGQLEHHVVHQAVHDPGPHGGVVDGARDQEAQGVDDVDEVVEDHRPGVLGQSDPVLLHEDQLARVLRALRVARGEAAVEADGEADAAFLGEVHQPLGVGVLIRDRLVDIGGDAGFEEAFHDLRVHGGRGVHERRVQPSGEEGVEGRVAAVGRNAVGVADRVERGGGPGLQMQFGPRYGGEHRQVRLLRDIAEPDATDLHEVSLSPCRAAVRAPAAYVAAAPRPPAGPFANPWPGP